MPTPSKIKTLPETVRKELEDQLLANHFGNYDALAEWLQEKGFEISRASVGRYGKAFKERCENIRRSTEMAVILSEQLGDEEGALGDAAIRAMQAELFDAMESYDWSKIGQMDPGELSLAVARLSRAGVNQKKWMAEVKQRIAKVADEVSEAAVEAGISRETANEFRTKILGIPAL